MEDTTYYFSAICLPSLYTHCNIYVSVVLTYLEPRARHNHHRATGDRTCRNFSADFQIFKIFQNFSRKFLYVCLKLCNCTNHTNVSSNFEFSSVESWVIFIPTWSSYNHQHQPPTTHPWKFISQLQVAFETQLSIVLSLHLTKQALQTIFQNVVVSVISRRSQKLSNLFEREVLNCCYPLLGVNSTRNGHHQLKWMEVLVYWHVYCHTICLNISALPLIILLLVRMY